MAWTVPASFSVGEQPPASKVNKLVTAVTELQAFAGTNTVQVVTLTAASGWTGSAWARKVGPLALLTIDMAYSGSTITAGTSGSVAPNSTVCTLPATWRPAPVTSYAFPWIGLAQKIGGDDSHWNMLLSSSGQVLIVSGTPNSTIAGGDQVIFNVMYWQAS